MGVYIKNMDMPKSCGECRFESAQYVNNYCRRTFCSLGADYEHCPLIEIPDALVSAWEDYKQRAKIISKVGRKTFAHKVFELEAED